MPQRPDQTFKVSTERRPPSERSLPTRREAGVLLPKPPSPHPRGRAWPLVTVWLVACLVSGWLAGVSLPSLPDVGSHKMAVIQADAMLSTPTVAYKQTLVPTPGSNLVSLPTLTQATPTQALPTAQPTLGSVIAPPATVAPLLPTVATTATAEILPTIALQPLTATPKPTITPIAAPTATAEPLTATPVPKPNSLQAALQPTLDKWKVALGSNADYGFVVHDLNTDEKVSGNPQKLYPTASVYKLFIMLTVYNDISQGHMSLDDSIVLTPAAADADDDGGTLIVGIGGSMQVRDLLYAMITASNNTAALMLMLQVRIPHLQQLVADMGFKETDLSDSYNFRTTAEDLDQFMTRLANQKLLGPKYDPAMLDLLSHQQVRDRIPALLPPNTHVANKTGNLGEVVNDTGLVILPNGKHYSISVLVDGADSVSAQQFISQLSLAAYNYVNS